MLDLKFVRENIEEVKENIKNRFMNVDVDLVLSLYEKKNELLQEVEAIRKQRNENAAKMKSKLTNEERQALIEEGKGLKDTIAEKEATLNEVSQKLDDEASRIPNMAHPDAPVGKEDKDNLQISQWGEVPKFNFKPKDHVQLGQDLDIIDFDTATKVTGPKFYYLKNQAVFLELALIRYTMDKLQAKGFTPVITPDLAKEEILQGIGFNPRGAESNIYTVEDTGMCLVGTAEITLGGYLSKTMVDANDLPIKFAGLSHCFRKEAGAAGQYSKGLYRVHQFTKVEMFVFCRPEESDAMHEKLREIEEEIFQGLEIPYRVVDTCTGDLGAPAYRKYDLEAWMPGRGESGDWGEVTSTSNCTDYQSRRLGIKYKDKETKEFLHMLNGTAVATSRAIIAVMENFQQEDGSILIPKQLQPYTGFDRIAKK
ncbi:MAG: serine--tRNA ligase [Spirochaetales bacterium]|nr:serine--tRNA ligase [Spirochaetales bacterium]